MIPLPDLDNFDALTFSRFDWLRRSGVPVPTLLELMPMREARGVVAQDGRFEPDRNGQDFLVFEEDQDVVFWQPRTGELATWNGRCFALGQYSIDNPGTYAFDCHLNIFAYPLDWLRNKCDGCVVLDWSRAFDRLRDCPRIAVSEDVLLRYRRHMAPPRLPCLSVLEMTRERAA